MLLLNKDNQEALSKLHDTAEQNCGIKDWTSDDIIMANAGIRTLRRLAERGWITMDDSITNDEGSQALPCGSMLGWMLIDYIYHMLQDEDMLEHAREASLVEEAHEAEETS